jgi:hypothetical protein
MIIHLLLLATTQDEFEMQADAIVPGQTVVVVDDIIATGALYHLSAADNHENRMLMVVFLWGPDLVTQVDRLPLPGNS